MGSEMCIRDSEGTGVSKTPHSWSEEKKYPAETISSRDRSTVDGTITCEGKGIPKTTHVWNKEEKCPSKKMPPNNQKPHKHSKGKVEFTRKGAVLPDVIEINNHIRFTRLSKSEHMARCTNLTRPCNNETECNEHGSFKNLKTIRNKLKEIISNTSNKTTDWKNTKQFTQEVLDT